MKELADYTSYNLSSEEEYMESIHYPELEKHRNEHSELIGEVFEGLTQFSERSGVMANDLLTFLNNWIMNHILGTDLKIKEFIK